MGTHVVHYYDEPDQHEMVEIDYQCSYVCMIDTLTEAGIDPSDDTDNTGGLNTESGSVSWGACPGGAETDYDVYCSSCLTLLWRGLQSKVD